MNESCEWSQDGEWWGAACNGGHIAFEDSNPVKENFDWCPYCGKPLVIKDE